MKYHEPRGMLPHEVAEWCRPMYNTYHPIIHRGRALHRGTLEELPPRSRAVWDYMAQYQALLALYPDDQLAYTPEQVARLESVYYAAVDQELAERAQHQHFATPPYSDSGASPPQAYHLMPPPPPLSFVARELARVTSENRLPASDLPHGHPDPPSYYAQAVDNSVSSSETDDSQSEVSNDHSDDSFEATEFSITVYQPDDSTLTGQAAHAAISEILDN